MSLFLADAIAMKSQVLALSGDRNDLYIPKCKYKYLLHESQN